MISGTTISFWRDTWNRNYEEEENKIIKLEKENKRRENINEALKEIKKIKNNGK